MEVVGVEELALVVLLVGVVDLVATAVTDGVLLVVVPDGVLLVVALDDVADVVGVAVTVGVLDGVLEPAVGEVVGVETGVGAVVVAGRPVEKVRSTQYWLACQLSLGKELLVPYV